MKTFEHHGNITGAYGDSDGYDGYGDSDGVGCTGNGNGGGSGNGYNGSVNGDGIGGMSTGGGVGVHWRDAPLLFCVDMSHLGARAVNLVVRMQPP